MDHTRPLTDRRCPICAKPYRWANDLPQKFYCWGDDDIEHEEHWEYVNSFWNEENTTNGD